MKKERLYSLDILRGADIFLLTVICPLVAAMHRVWKFPDGFMAQFRHPAWVGFSAHDMIMPLFIFMCGAALPFALPKRLEPDGTAGRAYWMHVLKRVALLWLFGLIAQGELLSYDLHRISFFNNTLQTIACGYLFAAVVARIRFAWIRVAIPFALAALYTAFLHACGDTSSPTANAAVLAEVKLLSFFYPSPDWHPVRQIADWHYTWWPTVPMFGAMGLAGWHATKILLTDWAARKKALVLAGVGVGLLALGGVLATFDPIVKHIFTASFTSLAMGVSFLLFAFSFWLFDIAKVRRGTWILNLYGRHSLFAYMYGRFFGAAATAFLAVFLTGTKRWFPAPVYGLLFQVAASTLFCYIVWRWDRYRSDRTR